MRTPSIPNTDLDQTLDKIICRGFTYECELGFHACESRIAQRITLDLIAWVKRIPSAQSEQPDAIRFDYFLANKLLRTLCAEEKFTLLETLTEHVAERLLSSFDIQAIEVSVTKYPLDMPNTESVAYVCYRRRPDA